MGDGIKSSTEKAVADNLEISTAYLNELMANMQKMNADPDAGKKPKQMYQFSGYFSPLQFKILAELLQKFEDDEIVQK